MGTVRDLFAPQLLYTSTRLQSWEQLYWPCLPKVGKIQLKSRLSRVIRAPPVMVAGMTPTTMHPDVVAAVMNAGYHAELAAGGYYNPAALEAAIYDLTSTIPYGRGITCNLIYANPQSMSWQIELLRRLSHSGVPIEGLTIGAGVPSVEVASNYIETLGLQHISFKPGSSAAILQVVEIAKRHPTFPIILQWTGGRGGGHHSFEDFHAPILATYAMLRQQSNMYLVAGSGLGDSDSIYPYLTGSWSTSSGQPAMPFDGVLLGSRMMVAQEAHTSLPVRKIIASTSGVPDEYWEQTYNGPAGGVITVMSEMGEPIHKIATRGVCLWAELDKTIFSLPQMERLGYLDRHRFSIIRRLNDDFAKPWFGRSIQGQVVNLEEMTYLDVLARLVELMYVEHKRWIDPSYVDLAMTVAQRWFERLPPPVFGGPENPTMSLLRDSPHSFLSKFASSCPTASEDLLSLEDISFFLIQCKRPGIKPVNFIPALDADFEFYFKKDSLWQAEDVEAVVGQDAGRVCILHGPVAAQYSRIESEPAAAILNTITAGLVRRLQSEPTTMEMITTLDSGFSSPGSWSTTSSKERDCSEESPCTSLTSLSELVDERLSSPARIAVPPSAVWPPWVQALFEDPIILQDNVRQQNPFGWLVQNVPNIYAEYDSENSELGLTEHTTDQRRSILKAVCFDGTDIGIEIYVSEAINPLVLLYRFEQKGTTMVLKEVHKKRNERVRLFYRRLWAGQDQGLGKSVEDTFYGPKATLTRELLNEHTEAIGAAFPDYRQITPDTDILPICYGIIQAWSVITHPLTLREVGGNLLRLVHRSNTFEYCGNAHPLRIGDTVSSKSTIQSVYDEDAGRVVVVKADIIRAKQLVMIVTSTFLLRGPSREVKSVAGFQKAKEQIWSYHVASGLEEALLLSRSWFKPISPSESFTEKTLVFVLTTATSYSDEGVMLHVAGSVFSSTGSRQQELGKVDFRGTCTGNPVLDFLERRGKRTELRTIFENPGWSGKSKMKVQMPPSNRRYAQLSKDFNPIHISPIFARLAGLPGKLCHGMLTAAVVEKVLELLGLEGDRARLRRFEVTFVDMVMPNEKLVVQIKHTGMVDGRMCFNIVASREKTDELVVQAEAEAEQPPTAYLFTGQGSQSKGMGMELYSTSAIAKAIWDEIDQKLHEKYGWSVLDIVRNNPTALTIHFGGREGRKIRKRYLDITTDVLLPNGRRIQKCVLPGLTATSTSYTFTHLKGLLYSTQFAQPAILLFEAAAFADLRAKGYVSDGAVYAGHSLGEYGALSALSRSIPTGALIELAFYRGSVMQASIAGDDPEAATYGMVAMNPKRVGEYFTQATLGCLVRHIAAQSEELLEIVNFNIDGEQYVCSGTTENLYTLGKLIDRIAESPNGSHLATEPKKSAELASLIESLLEQAKTLPRPIQLQRGKATIPLEGIDIPFHSSHLRRTVDRFRECLLRPGFLVDNIDVEQLVGKYIPNLMARPFSLDREYIQEAFELTQSPVLRRILSELSTCTG
ncbi:acyl transferase domain-containing protein [Aspergillus karnatakaensis]|uniref:acyl transferase domain-containing protein n=1 Tax=Aspergillus karnatakaensis TaxID=1810916 RepID=UPI003CCD2D7D